MASTKRIDLFIRPTSSATKQKAQDYAYSRANARDNDPDNFDENGEKIHAHYYDVTDSRTGAKYMVFGDDAQSALALDRDLDLLDKSEFLFGYTRDYIIDDVDGVYEVTVDNPHNKKFNVLLTVQDNLRADAQIENETLTSFGIALYDKEAFAEDKEPLDCSTDNVTVNVVVVFEQVLSYLL